MTQSGKTATTPLLHRFLGLGVTVLAGAFAGMTYLGRAPLLTGDDEFAETLAYLMSGVAAVLVVFALIVRKPRVPERQPGQSVDAYWATPAVSLGALNVWFLLEGAAMIAAVGYLLTGHPVVMIAMGLAIVVFWVTGPAAFAKS